MENQIDAISRILGKAKKEKNHESSRRVKKTVERHVWSISDENLAIDLYLRAATSKEVAEAIVGTKVKFASMLLKIENIRFLDTGKGLENVSQTTKALWDKRK